MYKWRVCPIQGRQLLDVREEDLFGDFRICHTYRGGGGYDQFPKIFKRRYEHNLSVEELGKQFVVQLYGCHLNCPYCYVTKDGIWGSYVKYTSDELIEEFKKSDCYVFHLMGGSPALYLDRWYELVNKVKFSNCLFTSDLLLTEREYKQDWLQRINRSHVLLAVNIKGVTSKDHVRNTNRSIDWSMFWRNLDKVCESYVRFYITFTNPDMNNLNKFKRKLAVRYGAWILEDSFVIDLIKYEALKEIS